MKDKIKVFFTKIWSGIKTVANNFYKFCIRIIDRIGVDRICHFCLEGFVVAICSLFSTVAGAVAFVAMTILEIFKENKDGQFDIKDYAASFLGGILALVLAIISGI